jgi:pilus assembly protein Flp/PilA
MVDPSVDVTVEGGGNRICVRDHAGDAGGRAVNLGIAASTARNFTLLVVFAATWACHKHIRIVRGKCMLGKFLRDESGATAIEYSLIAGFIALAIIAAVGMTGERLVALFESLIPALS